MAAAKRPRGPDGRFISKAAAAKIAEEERERQECLKAEKEDQEHENVPSEVDEEAEKKAKRMKYMIGKTVKAQAKDTKTKKPQRKPKEDVLEVIDTTQPISSLMPVEDKSTEEENMDYKSEQLCFEGEERESLNRPNPFVPTRITPAWSSVTRKPLAPFNATASYTAPSLVLRSAVSPSSRLLDVGSENTSNDNALQIAKKELEEAKTQITAMDEVITALKRERDLSISKLRAIEVMCKDGEATGNLDVNKVLEVISEAEEDFAVPTDNDADRNNDIEEAMDVTAADEYGLAIVPHFQNDSHTDRTSQQPNINLMLHINNLHVNPVDLSSVDNSVRKITRSSMSINKSKIRKGSFTSNVAERMNKSKKNTSNSKTKTFTNSGNRVSQISQLSSQPTVYMEPRIEPSPAIPLRRVENALAVPLVTPIEPNKPTPPDTSSQHSASKKPVMELSPTSLLGHVRDNLASSVIMPDGRFTFSKIRFTPVQRSAKKI